MNKGLKALKEIKKSAYGLGLKLDFGKELETIETELKRLEYIEWEHQIIKPHFEKVNEILRIIKEKCVCYKALLLFSKVEDYNSYCWLNNLGSYLLKSEFDLLKRWLKDE